MDGKKPEETLKHHEQTPGKQKHFLKEVKSLTEKVQEMGNPFLDKGTDLYKLDNKDIVDDDVIKTVNSIQKLGEDKFNQFVTERLIEQKVPIEHTIKKNKLSLFKTVSVKEKSRTDFEIATLKSNVNLFSNLYVACLRRESNLDEFFCYENQAYPPALTKMGEIRSTKKSDLVDCLLEGYEYHQTPEFDAVILDGPAIVNIIQPLKGQTFEEYAIQTLIPYVTIYQA